MLSSCQHTLPATGPHGKWLSCHTLSLTVVAQRGMGEVAWSVGFSGSGRGRAVRLSSGSPSRAEHREGLSFWRRGPRGPDSGARPAPANSEKFRVGVHKLSGRRLRLRARREESDANAAS